MQREYMQREYMQRHWKRYAAIHTNKQSFEKMPIGDSDLIIMDDVRDLEKTDSIFPEFASKLTLRCRGENAIKPQLLITSVKIPNFASCLSIFPMHFNTPIFEFDMDHSLQKKISAEIPFLYVAAVKAYHWMSVVSGITAQNFWNAKLCKGLDGKFSLLDLYDCSVLSERFPC
jgi:hypothetical protein